MKFSQSTILFSIVLGVASALPTADKVYPEVIPGPGLPSLASLGLTSEELYTMKPNETVVKRAPAFDPGCGPSDAAYTDVNDIIACFNYLNSLGHQNCAVPSGAGVVQMCRAGNGQILGQGLNGATSSWCSDVANAVLWVINDCTRPDQSVAGFQAANGNGNLIVGAYNVNW
ncbi:hypothetical protein F5884DRAFT_876339 [Xylogone sp. PMI_703]|nr:hypothetical protein F5884DRAFT_876339 [Xylogone sp. PMI_703]